MNEGEEVTMFKKLGSAVMFGITSFLLVVVNKVVLTTYKFPSFQAIGVFQMMFTMVTLYSLKKCKLISFPDFSLSVPKKIFPLPLFFFGNVVFGLGGTKRISLPMFVVLRRFAILFTMILEFVLLKVKAPCLIQLSVFLMVSGAIVAGSSDLAFDLIGYSFIMINNVCTAGINVYTKKKLKTKDFDLKKYGLLFYNSLFMVLPCIILIELSGDRQKLLEYEDWDKPMFVVYLSMSSMMGMVLQYSTMICTLYNSALTTSIVGVIKNLLVTYLGMMIGGDYIFSWTNFWGLNISCIGTVIYSVVVFGGKVKEKAKTSPQPTPVENGKGKPSDTSLPLKVTV